MSADESSRLDELLDQARRQLSQMEPIVPAVRRRLENASIRPDRRPWGLAVAAMLVLALAALSWREFKRIPSPNVVAVQADDLTLQIGKARLTEHVATLTDRGSVLIVWSYQGDGVTATEAPGGRIGKYRVVPLRQEKLADGRELVFSLYVPDPGVNPTMDPPLICTQSATDGVIAVSASLESVSGKELADAIRSTSGENADSIIEKVQEAESSR